MHHAGPLGRDAPPAGFVAAHGETASALLAECVAAGFAEKVSSAGHAAEVGIAVHGSRSRSGCAQARGRRRIGVVLAVMDRYDRDVATDSVLVS